MALQLGPILQFRGVHDQHWAVSALVVVKSGEAVPPIAIHGHAQLLGKARIACVPFRNPTSDVYRIDLRAPLGGGQVRLNVGEASASFHVPVEGASPRCAFTSCNGFSDPKLMKQVANKHERWQHLQGRHHAEPYHLLIMGGDQVYSDAMWQVLPSLKNWTDKSLDARTQAAFTARMAQELDRFFCELYLSRWQQPEVQAMLAAIPTVMMWDDHDIFDGWGSYPDDLHQSPVYQGIFGIARDYFRVFQQQLGSADRHPAALPVQPAFNLGFSNLGKLGLLVLDLRSERQPDLQLETGFAPCQIISPASWDAIYDWLDQQPKGTLQHLLVVSSIPVAYLDLGLLEKLLACLPGQQELEDDLRDHWRSIPHQQERLRLVHRLLKFAADKDCRVSLLSGDVHVGALAVIESDRQASCNAAVINQFISSGIVHPGPPGLVRYVLESIADKPEQIDRGIRATMQQIGPRGSHLLGARNWLAIEPTADGRLWMNWHLEGESNPLTKVVHPA
ncbi:alkaline phosphatase D family protein [Chitinivorax sp. B]|uniref:alkaline phosphatase D family protein n=1 Tax=Chitinivorax sp. B TaxID=2502235 RepID=UPI0010F788D8|nr:alkaline phosphatase D family protein [Chitinivorax sp. B]